MTRPIPTEGVPTPGPELVEALKGAVALVETLRRGPKEGQRYCYVESRSGSMVHVADALDSWNAALAKAGA